MFFLTYEYAVFTTTVLLLCFWLRYRFQWMLLLSSSLVFYAWSEPRHLAILSLCIGMSYGFARVIETARKGQRELLLVSGIASVLALLIYFKVTRVLDGRSLPLGISFFTFQCLTYLADVYLKRTACEKHIGVFATYVSFFPQLLLGPIERASHLIPQLKRRLTFNYDRVVDGLLLIYSGIFKKMVIAAPMSLFVSQATHDLKSQGALVLLLAAFCYRYYLFGDFSGYTDIAKGSAQLFGIRIFDNFKRPFFATSVTDFWKRWHLTLGSCFRDYLFYPMVRILPGRFGIGFTIISIFLLVGIWHDATWGYFLWGLCHGLLILVGLLLKRPREWIAQSIGLTRFSKFNHLLKIIFTFWILAFASIFVWSGSVSNAGFVFSSFIDPGTYSLSALNEFLQGEGLRFYRTIFFILVMEGIHVVQSKFEIRKLLRQQRREIRWGIYFLLVVILALFARIEETQDFVYFYF